MDKAALSAQLMIDEGMLLKPYRCTAGKLTIGVGRNLDDVGITKAEAMILLAGDIASVESDLDKNLPWWSAMSEARQQVAANMVFNLGINKFLGFVNTVKAMKEGRYADAAKGMRDSLWAKQVGARAERLAKMMEEG